MGGRPLTLPEEALRKLAQADIFSVGDVYWIPEEHLNYDSGERYLSIEGFLPT